MPICDLTPLNQKGVWLFPAGRGGSRPPSENKGSPAFFYFGEKKKGWPGPGPPGQPLAWFWASKPIPGLVLGLQASPWPGPGGSSPTQKVGSGPNHQKWAESGPELTVWPENWYKSMPGPLRSVSDRSRGQKKVKSLAEPPRDTGVGGMAQPLR